MVTNADNGSAGPLVSEVLAELEANGLVVSAAPDGFVVTSPKGRLPLTPHLAVSENLIEERLTAEAGTDRAARDETLSYMKMHLVEELTTDHLDGVNYTRSLGYRRDGSGRITFFADQRHPTVDHPKRSADLEWRA